MWKAIICVQNQTSDQDLFVGKKKKRNSVMLNKDFFWQFKSLSPPVSQFLGTVVVLVCLWFLCMLHRSLQVSTSTTKMWQLSWDKFVCRRQVPYFQSAVFPKDLYDGNPEGLWRLPLTPRNSKPKTKLSKNNHYTSVSCCLMVIRSMLFLWISSK